MKKPFEKYSADIKVVLGIALFGALLVVATLFVIFSAPSVPSGPGGITPPPGGAMPPSAGGENAAVVAFKSAEEFKEYLAEVQAAGSAGYGFGIVSSVGLAREGVAVQSPSAPLGAADGMGGGAAESVTRYSETNVQVTGIDEPDIVKNDGKNIYVSSRAFGGGPIPLGRPGIGMPEIMPSQIYYRPPQGEVKLVNAFPPADLKQRGAINRGGDLLLHKNMLVVFPSSGYYYYGGEETQAVYGFDVSNIASSSERWRVELDKKSSFVTARLLNGKIYAITATGVNYSNPCPIMPLRVKGSDIVIPCTGIYHPVAPTPADVTYTASIINPETGAVEKTVSFIGSTASSVIYMSPDALFIAYQLQGEVFNFLVNFFADKGASLLPRDILARLEKIRGYDLSDQTKLSELSVILERYYSSLDNDERQRIENEFANRMKDYATAHMRELERTGIVKVSLGDLAVRASGAVPGTLLNQFSMDAYNGYLRIATTISGQTGFYFGFGGAAESANDVYILDGSLNITGSVTGLGLTERIYSVRFIEDKGYVVTFRQTDPFYVLDLSNPAKPERKGELKIPGFSSYLDPIAKNRILGIGREGSNVKLSLFDVSSAENPKEVAKYTMSEYWSEIQNTHHAFLADREKEIFFIPGSRGGYVFSYKNDALELLRVVSDIQARRALYINNYLYIVGENEIVVLDESDWSKVKELKLN